MLLLAAAALAIQPSAQLTAAPADPEMVKLLPPDAAAAGAIDLAGLRSSAMFQGYMPMLESGGDEAEGAEESSTDDVMKQKALEMFENLETMVSGSWYEDPEAPLEREDLFVLRGQFGAADIEQFLAGAPATKLEHRGVTIHNIANDAVGAGSEDPADETAEPEPPTSLAFLTDSLAAAGSERLVRAAIDRHLDNLPAANESLLALGDPVAEAYTLWHIIEAEPLKALAPTPGEGAAPEDGEAAMAAGMMSGLLEGMDQMRIALKLDEGLGIRLEGLFASADQANAASQAIGGMLAMAQLGGEGAEGPAPPEALELLKTVELLSADRAAGLAVNITGEQIAQLMFAFMGAGLGAEEGDGEPF